MNQVYSIREYGSLIAGKKLPGYTTLPEHTFSQLEAFILSNQNQETDALELMGLSAKKGVGKVITAKNYVGILSMKDGTTIEILPKIDAATQRGEADDASTKHILIEMLRSLRNAPFKSMQTANVSLDKLNIFEIFIRMFVDEALLLVKRGLKCSYETMEENERFFKGKLLVSQQIKCNYNHLERSFVAYDVFHSNCPENRLLKATLLYLYHKTLSVKNKNDLRLLLSSFSGIAPSTDFPGDFAACKPDRNTGDYTTVLMWSRVFLMGKSFTSFAGCEVALALLFPMETLFESYVVSQLRKRLSPAKYGISVQDKTHHLFDFPGKKFLLKPDIVVTRKADHAVFVLDTKWKILTTTKANYGISQGDMYQMYAYQKKYGAEHVTLLYPANRQIAVDSELKFCADDGVQIQIQFVDLLDMKGSMHRIEALF